MLHIYNTMYFSILKSNILFKIQKSRTKKSPHERKINMQIKKQSFEIQIRFFGHPNDLWHE